MRYVVGIAVVFGTFLLNSGVLAATIVVDDASYRIGVDGGNIDFNTGSANPLSFAKDSADYNDYAAAVQAAPGFATSYLSMSESTPDEPAVSVTVFAEMTYFFAVTGPSGYSVPLDMSFAVSASAETVTIGNDPNDANIKSSSTLTVSGPGAAFSATKCAAVSYDCDPSTPSSSTRFEVTSGDTYRIDLSTQIYGFVGCLSCAAVGHASADPYLQIDPSFPLADEFGVVVSDGVPNVPLAVPEPSAWALTLLGFAGFGLSWRRKVTNLRLKTKLAL